MTSEMTPTESTDIRWAVRLNEPPEHVYPFLSTDSGRAKFWAETAFETGGTVTFEFPSGETHDAKIMTANPTERFVIDYFGSPASFTLREDQDNGTVLTLTHFDVEESEYCEMMAGWVSVLLALKGVINHSIDLRNHDKEHSWEQGYVGN